MRRAWWFAHNAIVHPLLAFVPVGSLGPSWLRWLHDWTGEQTGQFMQARCDACDGTGRKAS